VKITLRLVSGEKIIDEGFMVDEEREVDESLEMDEGGSLFSFWETFYGIEPYAVGGEWEVRRHTLEHEENISERSIVNFDLLDPNDTGDFRKGQQVAVYEHDEDYEEELIFRGFINDSTSWKRKGITIHEISCICNVYLLDKRLVAQAHRDKPAGKIVFDAWDRVWKEEGIVLPHEEKTEQFQEDWEEGEGYGTKVDGDKVVYDGTWRSILEGKTWREMFEDFEEVV